MRCAMAYGLAIDSDLVLPELAAAEAAPDVKVRVARPALQRDSADCPERAWRGTRDEIELCWRDVGSFVVRRGTEIIVRPAFGVEERVLRLYLLGPVLALLLHQRGLLVLHASAVQGPGGAVAFLGESGWGKSTTAASLHARGLNHVADDLVPVRMDDHRGAVVLPGPPRLKLWPDSASSLGLDLAGLTRLHPDLDKCDYRIDHGFQTAPMPLARIYVLACGERESIVRLDPRELFQNCLQHTYVVHLLGITASVRWHFQQCGELAKAVCGWRWTRRLSLANLAKSSRHLHEHLATDFSEPNHDERPAALCRAA